MKTLLCSLLLLGFGLSAHAEVQLIAGAVAPFVYREGDVDKGVAYDLLKEMAKRVGHSGKIELQPFVRALESAKAPGSLAIPIGRNATREKQYKWIVELIKEDFLVVADRSSKTDISSFEAIKGLRVGAMRGSVGERIALDKGFTTIEAVAAEEANAKKLDSGRIDLWLGAWNTILNAQRLAGLDVGKLRRGAVAQTVQIYLAADPGFDDATAAKWVAALDAMKNDGSYRRIIGAYKYELPQ